jgi:hypothetical protein
VTAAERYRRWAGAATERRILRDDPDLARLGPTLFAGRPVATFLAGAELGEERARVLESRG